MAANALCLGSASEKRGSWEEYLEKKIIPDRLQQKRKKPEDNLAGKITQNSVSHCESISGGWGAAIEITELKVQSCWAGQVPGGRETWCVALNSGEMECWDGGGLSNFPGVVVENAMFCMTLSSCVKVVPPSHLQSHSQFRELALKLCSPSH